MIQKVFISSFALLMLAMCQNQNVAKNTDSTASSSIPASNTSTEGGEMAPALPPDEEAVKAAEEEAKAQNMQNSMIYLKEGEKLLVKESGMTVTFKKMLEDSRCPTDVNCVWAGVAKAEIELIGTTKRPLIIQLSTMNNSDKGYQKTTNFDGYNYSLVEVSPELTSGKSMKQMQGQYKIGLKIEKGTSENTILQRN